MTNVIYRNLVKKKNLGVKSLAVLIDPDFPKLKQLDRVIEEAQYNKVDYFFVGGSLILQDRLEETIKLIREQSDIPVILFPGNGFQIHPNADAALFLSLVSGRNPEYLIGKQVEAAPKLYANKIEVIGTAYMLIDGGANNTAAYISQTTPIPHDKTEIAVATALASQFLGMKLVFADAGSGAIRSVPAEMIQKLNKILEIPLVVGGGIKNIQTAHTILNCGADVIVIGNAFEENPDLISAVSQIVKNFSPLGVKN